MRKGILVLAMLALVASAWADMPMIGGTGSVKPASGGGTSFIPTTDSMQYHTIFRDWVASYIVTGSNSRLYTATRFTPPFTGTVDSVLMVIWASRHFASALTDTLFFWSDTLTLPGDSAKPNRTLSTYYWNFTPDTVGLFIVQVNLGTAFQMTNGTDFWAGFMGMNRTGTPADSLRACCDTSLNNYNDREDYGLNGRALANWRRLSNAGLPRDWGITLFGNTPSGVELLTPNGPVAIQPKLYPASPNPFHGSGELAFDLPKEARVEFAIHDLSGRLVRTLAESEMSAGHHAVRWDGKDALGQPVASGVYLYTLKAGDLSATRTLVVVR